jgi:hypothetical protein
LILDLYYYIFCLFARRDDFAVARVVLLQFCLFARCDEFGIALYYYILVSSRAATNLGSPALWGRLVACGRLSIGLLSAAGVMPDERHRHWRVVLSAGDACKQSAG